MSTSNIFHIHMWSLACPCSCPSVWEALCLPAWWSGLWPDWGVCMGGSITLQVTSVLQEVSLCGTKVLHTSFHLITRVDHHVPRQRSRAGQDWLFTGTFASPWERLRSHRGLWNPILSPKCMALKRITLLVVHLQNPIFWASSCKTDAKCHRLFVAPGLWKMQRSEKKACMGKQPPANPKAGTVVPHTGSHVKGLSSWWVLFVVQTTICSSKILTHSLAP